MKILEDPKHCCGCHACVNICAHGAITTQADAEGFLHPQIDPEKCAECKQCQQVCPVLHPPSRKQPAAVYACKNRDRETRKDSTSGGIFSLLAQETISRQGVVFGAAFNERMEVVHVPVETVEGLGALRGSKYVQSRIGNTYRQAKDALQKGRPVLFTGTACQIAGMRSYLRKPHPNLLCVDVICHGVPSPLVFQKYVDWLQTITGSQVVNHEFRCKELGWPNTKSRSTLADGSYYIDPDNLFSGGFAEDLYLRPSCHECRFRYENETADITLGDYWGVKEKFPDLDYRNGISLVLVHTEAGQAAFDSISFQMESLLSDMKDAERSNSTILKSWPSSPNRERFFKRLHTVPIERLIAKYIRKPFLPKLLRKIRSCIGKISRILFHHQP